MAETSTTTDKPRRYIVVHQGSGRIVASTFFTHRSMERICARLDREYRGTYVYDDASAASEYLPQVGPNIPLRRTRVSS